MVSQRTIPVDTSRTSFLNDKGVEYAGSNANLRTIEKLLWNQGNPVNRKGPRGGGSFCVVRSGVIDNPVDMSLKLPSGGYKGYGIRGKIHAYSGSNSPSFPSVFTDAEMNALGATAIARTKPNKPTGGLSQALAELRELPTLPKLWELKDGVRRYKNLGSEYLNIQFGWVPFYGDLLDFFKNLYNIKKRIQDLDRNNDKWVRRRATLHDITTTSQPKNLGVAYGSPASISYFYGTGEQLVQQITNTDKAWFSGEYKFYVPPFKKDGSNDLARAIQFARIIFGLELTPRLVWELTPWTWLADWIGNIGDNISNISDIGADALVMRNCYVMRHTVSSTTYTQPINFTSVGRRVAVQTFFTEVKQRAVASPYGFGLKPGNFSPKQLAILGALGVSRAF